MRPCAEEGDKWKYGIQITGMDGTDKDEYFQILYDRDHSLAKTMSPSVSMIDDIFLNVQRRSAHTKNSKRQLPRIELNRTMETADRKSIGCLTAIMNISWLKLRESFRIRWSFSSGYGNSNENV